MLRPLLTTFSLLQASVCQMEPFAPPKGPRSGSPETTSKSLCRGRGSGESNNRWKSVKSNLGTFFEEKGATSVESLWKGVTDHKSLRTTVLGEFE